MSRFTKTKKNLQQFDLTIFFEFVKDVEIEKEKLSELYSLEEELKTLVNIYLIFLDAIETRKIIDVLVSLKTDFKSHCQNLDAGGETDLSIVIELLDQGVQLFEKFTQEGFYAQYEDLSQGVATILAHDSFRKLQNEATSFMRLSNALIEGSVLQAMRLMTASEGNDGAFFDKIVKNVLLKHMYEVRTQIEKVGMDNLNNFESVFAYNNVLKHFSEHSFSQILADWVDAHELDIYPKIVNKVVRIRQYENFLDTITSNRLGITLHAMNQIMKLDEHDKAFKALLYESNAVTAFFCRLTHGDFNSKENTQLLEFVNFPEKHERLKENIEQLKTDFSELKGWKKKDWKSVFKQLLPQYS